MKKNWFWQFVITMGAFSLSAESLECSLSLNQNEELSKKIYSESRESVGRKKNSPSIIVCPPLPKCCPPPPKCLPPSPVTVYKNPCRLVCDKIVLTPASHLCAGRLYSFLDVLFFSTHIGNADWAARIESSSISPSGENVFTNYPIEFKPTFGGRIGFGSHLGRDDWDTNFSFLWFQNKSSNIIKPAVEGKIWALHEAPASGFIQGENLWKVRFLILDWEIARAFFVSNHLILRPYLGIKGGGLTQTIKEKFISKDQSIDQYDLKSYFKGIGPKTGIQTSWILSDSDRSSLFIFGEMQTAVLAGRTLHRRGNKQASPTGLISPNNSSEVQGLNQKIPHPMLASFIGISWEARLAHDTLNLGIRLGYEVQYWLRQNQFLHRPIQPNDETAATITYFRLSDDLAIQGACLHIRIDF